MNARQIVNQLRSTLAAIQKLDGKLDKDAAAAIAAGTAVADLVRDWQRDLDTPSPSAAVVATLAAGRDPLDDGAVARALIGARLAEIMPGVDDAAGVRLANAAAEHLEAIVHAFDQPYDQATQRLAAAHDVLAPLGISHDSDPAAVLGRGVAATAAWANVVNATDVHAQIRLALAPLPMALGVYLPGEPVMFIDPAGHTLVELRRLGRHPHPLAVLDAGMTLSLAGPDEAQQRVDAMLAEDARRDAGRAAAQAAESRRRNPALT